MSMSEKENQTLRTVLVSNCLKNKGITSCEECLYLPDCKGNKINDLIIEAVKKWLEQKKKSNLAVLKDERYSNGEDGKLFYKGRVFEDATLILELSL